MNLQGMPAAVTGAASGLGQAVAQALHAQGARVALLDLNPEAVAHTAAALPGTKAWALDVADEADAQRVFREIHAAFGPVAVLVNCAGIATPGSVVRRGLPMPLDEFSRVIEVNLLGTINCMREAAAHMAQRHGALSANQEEAGVIINTASIAAFDGQVGQAAYSASKAGVAAMTLPLARELGSLAIRVMCIAPGVFATPMTLNLPEKSREVVFKAKPPHPRRPGKPEEFAELVCSIVSNPMLNGEVIRLDGGLRMPARQ